MNEQQLAYAIEGMMKSNSGHANGKNSQGKADDTAKKTPSPYVVVDGRIVRTKLTKDGPVINPLCNFSATVTEEVVFDDGAETQRAFVIEGRLDTGQTLPPVRVPSGRFNSMNWVTDSWGLRAIVHAGQATKDYLREAIQVLSPNVNSRKVFTHSGWTKIDGEWAYLTTNGAIGRQGVEVDLGPELSRYQLPREIVDPVDAMRSSLKLLEVAPPHITAPLWAGVFRAPLANAFPVDLSLWLEGTSGSLKSTLAALFLSHYGEFDRTHLPGGWSSTANQLERRAFLLKDALFVVDDYVPGTLDRREVEAKAARLLRSQGNLAGRGRLRADLTEQTAFSPRGLILSTGEQHPAGQSLLARTLIIRTERDSIDMERLTKAQNLSARLPHALAGYIVWLAPQMNGMPRLLKETFEGARTRATVDGTHLRIPEVLAHLWLAFNCSFTYAEEIGACSSTEAEGLRKRCWNALLQLGNTQGLLVEEERPSLKFLRVLSTLIAQGRVFLLPREDPHNQGPNGGDLVGWFDEENLFLIPDASFMAVSRFCREASEPLTTRQERLNKDLSEEGVSIVDPSRLTTTVRIDGRTKRVLSLNILKVESLLGETFPTINHPNHHYHHSMGGERDDL